MKCISAQWLVRLFEHLSTNPSIIVNGFLAASIPQSLDERKPVLDEDDDDDENDEDDEDDEDDDDDEDDKDDFDEDNDNSDDNDDDVYESSDYESDE